MVPAVREKFGLVHSNPYPTDETNHFRKNMLLQDTDRWGIFFTDTPVAKNKIQLAIRDGESGRPTATAVFSVIPANNHDLSVTTEHESAAIESGATDASRPAGFIRACRLLLDGLRIPLQQGNVVPRTSRRTRPSTDEPSAHPWHQISNSCCTKGRHFQVNAGIQSYPGSGPG